MAAIDITEGANLRRRGRGRPQVRPDGETRQLIYEAARHEFASRGYGATSIRTVARRAGVSTKTLYRLIPNKAALFERMASDRLDRFLSDVNLQAVDHADIDEALYAAPFGAVIGRSNCVRFTS
jgi:AcrR family transcriptional regulator